MTSQSSYKNSSIIFLRSIWKKRFWHSQFLLIFRRRLKFGTTVLIYTISDTSFMRSLFRISYMGFELRVFGIKFDSFWLSYGFVGFGFELIGGITVTSFTHPSSLLNWILDWRIYDSLFQEAWNILGAVFFFFSLSLAISASN